MFVMKSFKMYATIKNAIFCYNLWFYLQKIHRIDDINQISVSYILERKCFFFFRIHLQNNYKLQVQIYVW